MCCCNHSKIRDTLNNLILNSPQEWQTNVALPFVRIEGTTVEWDELRFDVRLLQRVPVSCRITHRPYATHYHQQTL